MDKVNLQTFKLDGSFKNSETSEEDILASLFSIPIASRILSFQLGRLFFSCLVIHFTKY